MFDRNAKKCEDRIASLQEDIEETGKKVEELEKEFKQIEVDATKALDGYQEAQVGHTDACWSSHINHTVFIGFYFVRIVKRSVIFDVVRLMMYHPQ